MDLVNRRVLITGATGGIGQAITRAFAAQGASVMLSGRRIDVLEPLAAELGGRVLQCDLGERQQLDGLVSGAGEVDVLVANAALPASGMLLELSQDEIDRMLEVNLRAPVALARAIAPAMVRARHGHIVFISSLAGKVTSPASSVYSAAKFGLRGFALALRQDLQGDGVGVSVVLPGFIREAGMFADANVELPKGVGTRSPEDVAAAVLGAVQRNRAEIEVAPASLRVGAAFAGLAPQLAASVSRRLGSEKTATDLAAGQRDKR